MEKVKKNIKLLEKIFFPQFCHCCNHLLHNNEMYICLQCEIEIINSNLIDDNILREKFYGIVKVENIFFLSKFHYGGKLQKLIHKLKYNGNQSIGNYLGKLLGRKIKKHKNIIDFDYIIPVPLSKRKLHQRGYNQSLNIAEGIQNVLKIPIEEHSIVRKKNDISQTSINLKLARWINVENDFEILNTNFINNHKILLVDDIITTGATISSIIKKIHLYTDCISVASLGFVDYI